MTPTPFDQTAHRPRHPIGILVLILMVIALYLYLFACKCQGAVECAGMQPSIVDRAVSVLVQVESRGDPSAVGRRGEVGLTQISPRMVRELNRIYPQYHFTLADRRDPLLNVVMCRTWLGWARVHYRCRTVRACCYRWNKPATGRPAKDYRDAVDTAIKRQS
jgi:hypothetical protein